MDKQHTLLVKNFAKDLKLLQAIVPNAKEIKKFGRKRALVYLANRQEANVAFAQLWAVFSGTTTRVQFLQSSESVKKVKNVEKTPKITRCTQTDWKWKDVGALPEAYIRQVYGIDNDILFDRPPPGYLTYEYPPATMDIVDAISIELMKNKLFYVKVLDMMNRMNLDPPFPAKEVYFRRGIPKSIGTQTGEEVCASESCSSSAESELSDNEIKIPLAPPVKRKKAPTAEQMQKKARSILHTTKMLKEIVKKEKTAKSTKKVFDKVPEKCTTIEIKIPLKCKALEPPFKPPTDLNTLILSEEQQKVLPIFQNYVRGEESDKLYIKNLAKNVSAEDLKAIYERFVVNVDEDLNVRVMQQGRMKGQAFVSFQSKTVDNKITAKLALEATHGLMLREKPIVVCFGKKQSD